MSAPGRPWDSQDLAPSEARGSLGTQTPQATEGNPPVLRGPRGQLLPGSHLNPRGRPSGRPNDSTLLANAELKAGSAKAARVILRALDSPNEWVALGAAKTVIERTLPADGSEPIDSSWVEWLTSAELKRVNRDMSRAIKRRDSGQPPPDAQAALRALPEPEPESQADELVIDVPAGDAVIDVEPSEVDE